MAGLLQNVSTDGFKMVILDVAEANQEKERNDSSDADATRPRKQNCYEVHLNYNCGSVSTIWQWKLLEVTNAMEVTLNRQNGHCERLDRK